MVEGWAGNHLIKKFKQCKCQEWVVPSWLGGSRKVVGPCGDLRIGWEEEIGSISAQLGSHGMALFIRCTNTSLWRKRSNGNSGLGTGGRGWLWRDIITAPLGWSKLKRGLQSMYHCSCIVVEKAYSSGHIIGHINLTLLNCCHKISLNNCINA